MTFDPTPVSAREILADVEHTRWAKWQRWMHSQCHQHMASPGDLVIPAALVERWNRQIDTVYADLSDQEKDSDRAEADTSIDALTDAGYEIVPVVRFPPSEGVGGHRHDWIEQCQGAWRCASCGGRAMHWHD